MCCLDTSSGGNYHKIHLNAYVKRAQTLFAFHTSLSPVSFFYSPLLFSLSRSESSDLLEIAQPIAFKTAIHDNTFNALTPQIRYYRSK